MSTKEKRPARSSQAAIRRNVKSQAGTLIMGTETTDFKGKTPDFIDYEPAFGPLSKTSRRWFRGDELEALPNVSWLIDGILPEGAFIVIFGPSGKGKSFAGLDWA